MYYCVRGGGVCYVILYIGYVCLCVCLSIYLSLALSLPFFSLPHSFSLINHSLALINLFDSRKEKETKKVKEKNTSIKKERKKKKTNICYEKAFFGRNIAN